MNLLMHFLPVPLHLLPVPICMPSDTADFTGRMATVTGWGRLKYGGGVPTILQEVQVNIDFTVFVRFKNIKIFSSTTSSLYLLSSL